ncbi:hypothetical protein ABZ249_08820 [Nocardiopsis sp. NPDC006139]|uniref:hypothetical protein n=1 Tax=unclassified Nocardiopsis TaxID=2649073 RepID=UPI00339F306E
MVVTAIANILTPLVAGFLPDVDGSSIDALVIGVVSLIMTFPAGYLAPHASRPDVEVKY